MGFVLEGMMQSKFYGVEPKRPFFVSLKLWVHRLRGHLIQRRTSSNRLYFFEDGPIGDQINPRESEETKVRIRCLDCDELLWDSED